MPSLVNIASGPATPGENAIHRIVVALGFVSIIPPAVPDVGGEPLVP